MRRFICNYIYIYIINWCFVTTTLCGVLVVCAASTFSFSSSSFSLSQLSLSTYIYPPSLSIYLYPTYLYHSMSQLLQLLQLLCHLSTLCQLVSLCQLLWRLGACLSWLRRMLRHFDISPSTLALRPSFRSAYVRPEKVAQMLKPPRHRAGPEEM